MAAAVSWLESGSCWRVVRSATIAVLESFQSMEPHCRSHQQWRPILDPRLLLENPLRRRWGCYACTLYRTEYMAPLPTRPAD